jgi:hypothetical protein
MQKNLEVLQQERNQYENGDCQNPAVIASPSGHHSGSVLRSPVTHVSISHSESSCSAIALGEVGNTNTLISDFNVRASNIRTLNISHRFTRSRRTPSHCGKIFGIYGEGPSSFKILYVTPTYGVATKRVDNDQALIAKDDSRFDQEQMYGGQDCGYNKSRTPYTFGGAAISLRPKKESTESGAPSGVYQAGSRAEYFSIAHSSIMSYSRSVSLKAVI